MARNQKNFAMFDYLDDNGVHWNVRGESGGAGSGVDGHSTDYSLPVWGKQTRQRHVRYGVATDSTTFRTVKFIVYTPTAFAALAAGDDIGVPVAGLATNVTYDLSAKIPEKQPIAHAPRALADA